MSLMHKTLDHISRGEGASAPLPMPAGAHVVKSPNVTHWTAVMAVAAIYAGDWGDERRAPAPAGGGVWGGSHAPSPEKFSIFELEKVSFGAFWVLLLQLN